MACTTPRARPGSSAAGSAAAAGEGEAACQRVRGERLAEPAGEPGHASVEVQHGVGLARGGAQPRGCQPGHARRAAVRGELEGHPRAEGVAHQVRAGHAERLQHLAEAGRERRAAGVGARRQRRGRAVPRQVHRQHVVAGRQRREHRRPDEPRGPDAVHQDQRGRIARRPAGARDGDAADEERRRPREEGERTAGARAGARAAGAHATSAGRPPVMRTSSSNVVGNTAFAWPAAAHTCACSASVTSTRVSSGAR